MKEIVVEKNDSGQRIDRFLRKYLCNAPLSVIYKLMRKDIKLKRAEDSPKRVNEDFMLCEGDIILCYASEIDIENWTSRKKTQAKAKKQFSIVYEDDDILIVNKPFGLLVHGDKNEKKDTLANQVIAYLIDNGSYNPRSEKSFVPSPVHRLDRNTTGIVVFGKNAESLRNLSYMFKEDNDDIRKFYYTIVHGKLDERLHLRNKLLKDEQRNKGIVLDQSDERGKYIETIVKPLCVSKNGKYSLIEIELVTGRSHQIRAHLAYTGHPLVGDTKYGGKEIKSIRGEWAIGRTTQALHAHKIIIEGREYRAELPKAWEVMQQELFERVIVK